MTTQTREEIERMADELIEPYGENIIRRTKAADALLSLLADRDRIEQERDEAIADAKEIAETNLRAASYIEGQRDGAAILRASVAELEEALKQIEQRDRRKGGCTSEDAWDIAGPFAEMASAALTSIASGDGDAQEIARQTRAALTPNPQKQLKHGDKVKITGDAGHNLHGDYTVATITPKET